MSQIDTAKTMKPAMIRVKDAFPHLGISEATFYRLVKKGQFEIIKRGKMSYVRTSEVDAYLDPNETEMVG